MLKNNVVTEKRTKKVKVLSAICEGKKHEKKLADEQTISFSKGSKVWKDTVFQGYEEHSIGGIKVYRIVQGVFRNFCEGFDDLVTETACGLYHWRLDFCLPA